MTRALHPSPKADIFQLPRRTERTSLLKPKRALSPCCLSVQAMRSTHPATVSSDISKWSRSVKSRSSSGGLRPVFRVSGSSHDRWPNLGAHCRRRAAALLHLSESWFQASRKRSVTFGKAFFLISSATWACRNLQCALSSPLHGLTKHPYSNSSPLGSLSLNSIGTAESSVACFRFSGTGNGRVMECPCTSSCFLPPEPAPSPRSPCILTFSSGVWKVDVRCSALPAQQHWSHATSSTSSFQSAAMIQKLVVVGEFNQLTSKPAVARAAVLIDVPVDGDHQKWTATASHLPSVHSGPFGCGVASFRPKWRAAMIATPPQAISPQSPHGLLC